jgi:hypothetical protein
MILREYYPLGDAMQELGLSLKDVMHLAATDRIRLFIADPGPDNYDWTPERYAWADYSQPEIPPRPFNERHRTRCSPKWAAVPPEYAELLELRVTTTLNLTWFYALRDGHEMVMRLRSAELRCDLLDMFILPADFDWIKAGMDAAEERPMPKGPWPWGTHTTPELDELALAVRKWWVNVDMTDPTSVPTNETVINWLLERGKVSKNLASAIASIIRPPGATNAPRPKE